MAIARRLALLPALGLTIIPIHAAQVAQSDPASQSPPIRTTTRLVLVDVVVSQNDQLVHGLDRGRFHVFENGQEQPILSFDEHRAPANSPSGGTPAIHHVALPPHTYTNVPDYPQSGAVTVLLLDGLNTPHSAQMDVRRQMIEYLTKIKPGTALAVFTLTSRLRMVTGFTTDVATLDDIIKSSKGSPQSPVLLDDSAGIPAGAIIDATQSAGLNGINNVLASGRQEASEAGVALQQFKKDVESFQTDQQVRLTLDAMQQLVRTLSVIPGRKNIIWFSAAFPLVVLPDPPDPSNPRSFNNSMHLLRDSADQVRETTQMLADARVAIYPIDARGLTLSSAFDASLVGNTSGQSMQRQIQKEQDLRWEQHSAMNQIAEQTGGKAFWNTNEFGSAIDEVVDQGWSYYTIGYAPAAKKFDGQFHTFQVRIDDRTCKIAYRDGYFADPPDAPRLHHASEPAIVAASMHGRPGSSQIAFDARILPASDPKFAATKLDQAPGGDMTASLKAPVHRHVVDLLIDPHTLRFDNQPDGSRRLNLEIALVAYDQQGNRVNYVEHPYQMTIGSQRFTTAMSNNGLAFRTVIDLPEGQLWLRVALHDSLADTTGSLEAPVSVAKTSPPGAN